MPLKDSDSGQDSYLIRCSGSCTLELPDTEGSPRARWFRSPAQRVVHEDALRASLDREPGSAGRRPRSGARACPRSSSVSDDGDVGGTARPPWPSSRSRTGGGESTGCENGVSDQRRLQEQVPDDPRRKLLLDQVPDLSRLRVRSPDEVADVARGFWFRKSEPARASSISLCVRPAVQYWVRIAVSSESSSVRG